MDILNSAKKGAVVSLTGIGGYGLASKLGMFGKKTDPMKPNKETQRRFARNQAISEIAYGRSQAQKGLSEGSDQTGAMLAQTIAPMPEADMAGYKNTKSAYVEFNGRGYNRNSGRIKKQMPDPNSMDSYAPSVKTHGFTFDNRGNRGNAAARLSNGMLNY